MFGGFFKIAGTTITADLLLYRCVSLAKISEDAFCRFVVWLLAIRNGTGTQQLVL